MAQSNRSHLAALLALALALPSLTQAQTNTFWSATPANASWGNAANWSDGAPPPGGNNSNLILNFGPSAITTLTHDGDRAPLGIVFAADAPNYTINTGSGGVIYGFGEGITSLGGAHVFNAQFRPRVSSSITNNSAGLLRFNTIMAHLTANGPATITFGGSGNTQANSIIRRNNNMLVDLVKSGAGTLTVTGGIGTQTPATPSADGALAGNISVLEGTLSTPQLRIGTQSTSSIVTVAAGATLNVTGNTTTIDSAVAPGFGTLNVAGTFTEAGNLIVGQNFTGIVNQSAGTITVNGNTILAQNAGSTGIITQTGGTFTTTGNFAEPAAGGTSTLNLNNGTMTVGGNLSVDTLQVGFAQGTAVANASLAAGAGSTVRIGDGSGFLTIARMMDNPATPDLATADARAVIGTLDLSQAANTTIDVATIRMATANLRGTQNASLLLGGATTLNANTFMMAEAEGDSTPGSRNATLSLGQTNTFNIDSWTIGSSKSTGSASFNPLLINPTLTLSGNNNASTNLTIGNAQRGTGISSTSSLNVSPGTFNASLDTLRLGNFATTGAGNVNGSLTMGAGTVTANQVILAHSTGSSPNSTVGTLTINGGGSFTVSGNLAESAQGGTSNVNVNIGSMSVGGNTSVDNLQVGFVTGTVPGTIANASFTAGAGSSVRIGNGGGSFTVARMVSTPGSDAQEVRASVDLSQAANTTINVATLRMATSNFRGRPRATLLLGGTTTLNANTFMMADAEAGDTPGGRSATLSLGQTNDFNINNWTIGGRKSNASVSFDPLLLNPTLNLSGNTTAAANLIIGDNNTGTGAVETSSLDLSGGTFNATLDTLRIGRFGTSTGSAIASLTMGAGTVTANQVVLAHSTGSSPNSTVGTLTINGGGTFTVNGNLAESAQGGTSNVNVNIGTMSVGGNTSVDNLQVGFVSGAAPGTIANASFTAGAGSSVRIGTGTGFFTIARMVSTPGSDAQEVRASVDLSQAANTTINVGTLRMATSTERGRPRAELFLGGTTTLNANTFMMADAETGTTPGGRSATLSLGQTNDFNVNTWTIGGRKSNATVTFDPLLLNPTLNLSGNTTVAANLIIGDNNAATGALETSTLDLGYGTFNATLDTVRIARFGTSNGGSNASLIFGDGTVTARQIIFAETSGSVPLNTSGTLIINGGQLIAGSITKGTGSATVLFNAGTLAFNSYGSLSQPMSLNNTGTGIVNPGVDASGPSAVAQLFGTSEIFGAYTQGASAALRIDLDGAGNNDRLVVRGNVFLDGLLSLQPTGPYLFSPGEITLIDNLGPNPVFGTFSGLAEGAFVGPLDFGGTIVDFYRISYLGGDGNNVVLFVPEPARALLLLIASASLLLRRRRP